MRKIFPFISNYAFAAGLASIATLALWLYSPYWLYPTFPASLDTGKIISLTNEQRAQAKLAPVILSTALEKAAQAKAADIFKKQYFNHISPTGAGTRYWLKKVGYNFVQAGENLSLDFYSEEGVIKNWMTSPSHKSNILMPEYADIGVAALGGRLMGKDRVIVVQFFGQPGKK